MKQLNIFLGNFVFKFMFSFILSLQKRPLYLEEKVLDFLKLIMAKITQLFYCCYDHYNI